MTTREHGNVTTTNTTMDTDMAMTMANMRRVRHPGRRRLDYGQPKGGSRHYQWQHVARQCQDMQYDNCNESMTMMATRQSTTRDGSEKEGTVSPRRQCQHLLTLLRSRVWHLLRRRNTYGNLSGGGYDYDGLNQRGRDGTTIGQGSKAARVRH